MSTSTKTLFNRAAAMADESDQAPIIDKAQPLLFLANARRVASGFIANAFQSDAQRKAVFAKYGSGATSRLKKVADKSKRESDANGDKRDFRYGGTKDLNKQTPEQIAARGPSKDTGAYEQTGGGGSSDSSASGGTTAAAGSGLASTAPIQAKPTQEAQGSALASAIVKAINEGKINPATTPAPWIDGLGNYNPAWGPLFSGPAKQAIIDAWVAAGGAAPDMGGMESIAPIPQAAEEPAPVETPQQGTVIQSPAIVEQPVAAPDPGMGEYDLTQPLTTQPALNINPNASATPAPTPTPTPTDATAVETNYGATTGAGEASPHWSVPEQELMRRKNKQQTETVMEKMKTMPLNLNAAKRLIRNAVRVAADEVMANAFQSDSARKAFFARGGARVKKPIYQRPGGSGPIQSALGAKPATQFDPATGTWSATPRPPANEARIMQIIAGQPQAETVAPGNDTQGSGLGTSTVPVNIQTQRQQAQIHAQAVRAQQNEKAKQNGMANMDNLAKKAQPAPQKNPKPGNPDQRPNAATLPPPAQPARRLTLEEREAEANKARWAAEAEARRKAKEYADALIAENKRLWADPVYVAAQKKKNEDAHAAEQAARKAKKQAELDNYLKVMAEREAAGRRSAAAFKLAKFRAQTARYAQVRSQT